MTSFADLGLVAELQRAVRDEGYTSPTPIQAQAIPHLLQGRDLLGCARTGTGKTAAFSLPILQRLMGAPAKHLARHPRCLVVVPTRELAAQVAQSFETYGRFLKPSIALVYGGVGQGPQVRALARGVDVLVATPGRLVDLMGQGHVKLDKLEVLVLDEADQMLDLGFLPDVRRIVAATPKRRQTLLFSATMPPAIAGLADSLLHQPAKVMVTPPASTVELIDQRVHFVPRAAKLALLVRLLSESSVERALVFTRTKRGADKVARGLEKNRVPASAIHGNKSQGQRERTLGGFRDGRTRVLVATDIAARGIDVDGVTHVFNFELPNVPEVYVHRIGRTARAGASGIAISLCDGEEREYLRDIEKLTKRPLTVVGDARGDRSTPSREGQARPSTPKVAHHGAKPHAPRAHTTHATPKHPRQHSAPKHSQHHSSHAPRRSATHSKTPAHRGPSKTHRPATTHRPTHTSSHSKAEHHAGFGAGLHE